MIRTALSFLGAVVAAATPAGAQARHLVLERFDAAIRVQPDGTVDVTEAITVRFVGSWNGIYRTIPVEYRTPQGFNWTLGLELVGATDDAGTALRVERSRERHYVKYKIWVPGAQDTRRTVNLRYRARNGLRFFQDHDELYWNVTGDEWEVPIEAAAATVELPTGATGVRATAFNGPYGSTARDASVQVEGTRVRVTLPVRLEFREGLTVVIGWDKGLVAEPTRADRALGFLASNWPLAIPIPVFFVMLAVWRRRGRDPERFPVAVQYEPSDDLAPAEAGTLIDNSVDMRDITATIVDLAVRGFLRVEERQERRLMGLLGGTTYVLHRLKPPGSWGSLRPHEREVLAGLFEGDADSVELSELENEFYTSLPKIRKGVFDQLLARGYYQSHPDTVRGIWLVFAVLAGAAVAIGGSMLSDAFSLTPVPFVVAGVLTFLTVGGFALVMPARTVAGARAMERVRGFEEFLRRVDDYRARIVAHPELFDRFLPYAMAFGVEKKWAKAFEGIYREPPTWYAGPSGPHFSPNRFAGQLAGFTTRAGSTMASSPRSSSGSGFSGGSSGGGGGGGGGGGF